MAITTQMRTDVTNLYVSLFNRAPERDGLGFWVNQLDAGKTVAEIAQSMYDTEPARATYPTFLTNEEIVGKFYSNVLGRTADAEGLAFWTGKLNAGASKGALIAEMISAVQSYAGTDTAALASKALLANKVAVGLYYAVDLGGTSTTNTAISGITADAASVTTAKAALSGTSTVSASFSLTAGTDQADATGSVKNGGLVASDFKFTAGNEKVTAVSGTLAAGDVLADSSTADADVLNATLSGAGAVAVSLTNIETINLDVKTATGGLDMTSVSGTKAVNVTGTAAAQITNISKAAAPTVGVNNYNSTLTVGIDTLAGTTAAGTAESLTVAVSGVTATATGVAGLTLTAGTAGSLETLNLASNGTTANTLTLTAGANVTAVTKTVVTGAADLQLRGTAGFFNGMDLAATEHTGKLTVRADFDGGAATIGLNAEKFAGVDAFVVTDSAATAGATGVGLYNIGDASTITFADDIAAASIITVLGSAANTANSVNLVLQNRATTATDVDLTGLTIGSVEAIKITSSGAPTTGADADQQNSTGNLTAGSLETLTLDGASNLAVTLAAGSIASTNTKAITIDGSAATGKLAINAGDIANFATGTRTVTIKSGTADDTLTGVSTVAVKTVYDLTAGGKDTVVAFAGDTNDQIISFTNGDKIAVAATTSAVAGTFVNGLSSTVISAANQATVESAANLGAAATAAAAAAGGLAVNAALAFSYQGNQYILLNEATADAYDAASDAIVQVAGLTGTSTFDAGTFLFAV